MNIICSGRSSDLLPLARPSRFASGETVTMNGLWLRSLQLRDSPGFTPGSLLITIMRREPKAVQRYGLGFGNANGVS